MPLVTHLMFPPASSKLADETNEAEPQLASQASLALTLNSVPASIANEPTKAPS